AGAAISLTPQRSGSMASATAQTSVPAATGGAAATPARAVAPPPPRLAAVDIGTNSMRLVIAEVQPDGSYRVLDQDREMTRLGRGLYASGRIGDGPMEQSLQTLGRLGAVRVSERYCKSDPLRRKHWKALRRGIDDAIDEKMGKPPFAAEVMIGSGGTFTNLAEMAQLERDGKVVHARDYAISRAEVVRFLDRLRETPLEARRQIAGLNPRRADIMVAGVAAIARLMRRLGTQRVLVNDRGIRDGVLLSMIDDLYPTASPPRAPVADRMDVVRRFARKCHSNERHCEQVATLAASIFDALKDAYALPASGRDILQAAALLHDIGYLINHEKHHTHAYHLIMHGDLRGFSSREIELIANVARYHRRAPPKKTHANFARLDRGERRLVRRLSGVLRVADGLDRAHGQVLQGVRCRVGDGWVRMLVRATRDPAIELEDAKRKATLFERAFHAEQLAAIESRVHELVAEQYRILGTDVLPGLATGGIERVRFEDLNDAERRHVDALFRASIYPVLTPLAIDPGHPFPHVHNKSL